MKNAKLIQFFYFSLLLTSFHYPFKIMSQTYLEEDDSPRAAFNDHGSQAFLWLGGAALTGGIVGALAGRSSAKHHSCDNAYYARSAYSGVPGPMGPQGIQGPVGPVGPTGPTGPGFMTTSGEMLVGLTVGPLAISGTMNIFLSAPDGTVTPLTTLSLPLSTVVSLGPFNFSNPVEGTYAAILEISSDTLGFPSVASLGKLTIAYTLGDEVQVLALPGIGAGIVAFYTQVAQPFGFSPAVFME